uniref:Glutathione S-transferase n=1 Tax=Rhabditophanes sp. KR3021 TaxID=114890 RepID=A0AC35U363_9BILA
MSSEKITFTYFDGMGRGEVTRILLHYVGQEYNDVRISFEQWPKIKADQPFKRVPVIDIDGVQIAQSRAIEQLFARRFNLLGKDEIENALIMQYLLSIDDSQEFGRGILHDKDEEKKKQRIEVYVNQTVKPLLVSLEGFLNKNGTGYFVGSNITLADLGIFQYLWIIEHKYGVVLTGALKEFLQKIGREPKIQKYISSRPESYF